MSDISLSDIELLLNDYRQNSRNRYKFYQKKEDIEKKIIALLQSGPLQQNDMDMVMSVMFTIDDSPQVGFPLTIHKTDMLLSIVKNILKTQEDILLRATAMSHLSAAFPNEKVLWLLFQVANDEKESADARDEAYLSLIKNIKLLNELPIAMNLRTIMTKFIDTTRLFKQSNIPSLENRANTFLNKKELTIIQSKHF
ncbi:MAG: hypothetical protein HON94_00345 [Methylococcales bacterium]|nr:hypothetical protein [Methylococcales bacterium]MBT7408110.1 hypothetical protein [Methylococcales bacterium]